MKNRPGDKDRGQVASKRRGRTDVPSAEYLHRDESMLQGLLRHSRVENLTEHPVNPLPLLWDCSYNRFRDFLMHEMQPGVPIS